MDPSHVKILGTAEIERLVSEILSEAYSSSIDIPIDIDLLVQKQSFVDDLIPAEEQTPWLVRYRGYLQGKLPPSLEPKQEGSRHLEIKDHARRCHVFGPGVRFAGAKTLFFCVLSKVPIISEMSLPSSLINGKACFHLF